MPGCCGKSAGANRSSRTADGESWHQHRGALKRPFPKASGRPTVNHGIYVPTPPGWLTMPVMTPLRSRVRLSRILLSALLLASLVSLPARAAERSGFQARRGTNISHWLSQSRNRGDQRRTWFTREDVAFLAGLGFDHLRIPIDEELIAILCAK